MWGDAEIAAGECTLGPPCSAVGENTHLAAGGHRELRPDVGRWKGEGLAENSQIDFAGSSYRQSIAFIERMAITPDLPSSNARRRAWRVSAGGPGRPDRRLASPAGRVRLTECGSPGLPPLD